MTSSWTPRKSLRSPRARSPWPSPQPSASAARCQRLGRAPRTTSTILSARSLCAADGVGGASLGDRLRHRHPECQDRVGSCRGGFVGIAVGVSLANNTIGTTSRPQSVTLAVAAASGDIKITADYNPTIHTASFVQALAAGLAVGTGAGAQTSVSIAGTTAANVDAHAQRGRSQDPRQRLPRRPKPIPTTTALSDALEWRGHRRHDLRRQTGATTASRPLRPSRQTSLISWPIPRTPPRPA